MTFLRRINTILLSSFLLIILMGCASDRPFGYLIPSTSIPAPRNTPAPSKTRTPIPPTQRAVRKTLTPSNSCYPWDEITIDMKYQKVCVTGEVIEKYSLGEAITRINFSEKPNTFFSYADNQIFQDIDIGDCIRANGNVMVQGKLISLHALEVAKCPDQ